MSANRLSTLQSQYHAMTGGAVARFVSLQTAERRLSAAEIPWLHVSTAPSDNDQTPQHSKSNGRLHSSFALLWSRYGDSGLSRRSRAAAFAAHGSHARSSRTIWVPRPPSSDPPRRGRRQYARSRGGSLAGPGHADAERHVLTGARDTGARRFSRSCRDGARIAACAGCRSRTATARARSARARRRGPIRRSRAGHGRAAPRPARW